MQIVCPQCGTPYELGAEYAGKRVRCRNCQAVIEVSAADSPAQPPAYSPPAGMPGGQYPYGVDRAAGFETHRKLVGIFNIIVGVLSLLWAGLCLLEVVVFAAMPQREFGPDGPPKLFGVGMFFVMLLLSLVTGIIQVMAGTKILKGSAGARNLGLISGFASCASLWGCCVYPFCLGSGVYTLIILFGQAAKDFLEKAQRQA